MPRKGERLDEAILLIKRALLLKPDNGYILDSLAWAYYQKGMLHEALEFMKKAVAKTKDDDPVMREHFGDIYFKLGDRRQGPGAVAAVARARSQEPETQGQVQEGGIRRSRTCC